MDYDVIIAGASFGGLAVAAQLRGWHVLLVEPKPLGAVRTSACGTLLSVLKATKTLDSLLQVHHRFVLHLGGHTYTLPLPDPFCTFDYYLFCRRLFAQTDATLLAAAVLGHDEHRVYTTRGTFSARVLVDASGWRAALKGNGRQTPAHTGMSFGLETTVPVREDGLHFWYDPAHLLPKGVTWLFPTGAASRTGMASYLGQTRLKSGLERWLEQTLGQEMDGFHGGYFPYRRRPATNGHVFRVGDAAGQCLPLTGEGIRPALYFGAVIGRLARMVIGDLLSEEDALCLYRQQVSTYRPLYDFLLVAQKLLTNIPVSGVEMLAALIQRAGLFAPFMRRYRQVIEPAQLGVRDLPAGDVLLFGTAEGSRI